MAPCLFRRARVAACLLSWFPLAVAAPAAADDNPCGEDHVTLQVVRTEWRDTCTGTPCPVLVGIGSFQHACPDPIGVRVRLRALDGNGDAVAISEMWPFGRRNVAAGVHEFSVDQWIGHDPEIVSFEIIPVGLVRWPPAP